MKESELNLQISSPFGPRTSLQRGRSYDQLTMRRPLWTLIVTALALSAPYAKADQFNIGNSLTVRESSINPNLVVNITTPIYSGGAHAGINQLLINGSQIVNGFCIDPFHFSSSQPLSYTVVNLADAPKGDLNPLSSGGMGAGNALTIEKLWAAYYSPNASATDAATLQLAIWDVVGGSTFTTTSTLNVTAENWISTVNTHSGPAANLVGLTGSGQDYVVQSAPEPGSFSLTLSGVGLVGLMLAMRKRLRLGLPQAS
jgi:PEP-CTERM motif